MKNFSVGKLRQLTFEAQPNKQKLQLEQEAVRHEISARRIESGCIIAHSVLKKELGRVKGLIVDAAERGFGGTGIQTILYKEELSVVGQYGNVQYVPVDRYDEELQKAIALRDETALELINYGLGVSLCDYRVDMPEVPKIVLGHVVSSMVSWS